jgi:hypothetical protein
VKDIEKIQSSETLYDILSLFNALFSTKTPRSSPRLFLSALRYLKQHIKETDKIECYEVKKLKQLNTLIESYTNNTPGHDERLELYRVASSIYDLAASKIDKNSLHDKRLLSRLSKNWEGLAKSINERHKLQL